MVEIASAVRNRISRGFAVGKRSWLPRTERLAA